MGDDSDREDYDLGREVEKSWLYRGEYDKAFAARGAASLIFGGVVLAAIVIGLLFKASGSELDGDSAFIIVAGLFALGLIAVVWQLTGSSPR